jgi:tetratricopeptide (TPR) repeat protein
MRALEKDRTRRYQTAGELSAEILRYLSDEPVSAGPPSAAYRARKFLRRHRVGVAAGATVAVALIVGLGAALIGLRSAVDARDAEATARKRAETALEFVSDMFGAVDPRLARGHDVTVAEIVDPAAAKVARSFAGDAEGEAVIRGILGEAYANLARYPDALREFGRAFELRQAHGQADTPQALSLRHNWASTLLASGDVARARELLQRVWEQRSTRLGPAHRDALATRSLLAYAKQLAGDLDGATTEIREVLRDQERSLGPGDRDTLESLCSLADMLNSAGQLEEGLRVAHEARRPRNSSKPPAETTSRDDPSSLTSGASA